MAKQKIKEKSDYQKEKEIAKQVINELENSHYAGICHVLENSLGLNGYGLLRTNLPKLYLYLSQRNNYAYSPIFGNMGRIKGNHSMFYWTPYKHTNRIKTLKKVYNIK